ncbi:hypothetical protein [Yoonia algicola]|uniref:Squalene cyclase C-terminal domain-containing protein n=1 Tax=Yoonia algicola TaxID=3137368 RepID=A0AAN0NEW6_9RHOB
MTTGPSEDAAGSVYSEPSFSAKLTASSHFSRRALVEALQGRRPLLDADPESIPHDLHLSAGATWLKNSIEACGGQASSKAYRFPRGWMPPYPETTGYIIPTLLNLGDVAGDKVFEEMALRLGRWLTTIQRQDGGFSGYELGSGQDADVFDTGMILLGFNALQHRARDPEIGQAAARAAAFLRSAMDDDGAFVRHVSHDMLHTYNVRSAWALIAHGTMESDQQSVDAGMKNVDWTLSQQRSNGFFENNGFKPGGNANTHGTAYVLRGLLQVHLLTHRQDILDAVLQAAVAVRDRFEAEGWLASELGRNWEFRSRHVCLTGCAQLAIVFFRLAALTKDLAFIAPAERLIAQVAVTQTIKNHTAVDYGGIAGSYPIFGAYAPLQYPNWATKFMVDALLVRKQWHESKETMTDRDLWAG